MSPQLAIRSLGGLRVFIDGAKVSFETKKVAALFIYLAGTARAHPREVLATMFWEGYAQIDAQRNFRRMLANLRKDLGDFLVAPRGGDFVALNMETDIWFDFAELESHLLISVDTLPPTAIEDVIDALKLYEGPFLQGFYPDSPDFESWASGERDRLERRVAQALRALINIYLLQGRYPAGIELINRLLTLDELDEEAYRLYMVMLALSGQRVAALKQYEACRQILEREMNLEPEPETQDLYQRIRDGLPLTEYEVDTNAEHDVDISSEPHLKIPSELALTPFVGRVKELAEFHKIVDVTHSRLITIVGFGGMGKTRFAIKIAKESIHDFADGIYFVPLADLTSHEQIIPALADALNLELSGDAQATEEILTYLDNKHVLLIMDNFEEVLDGAELVAELLYELPQLFVIVTSREMLYLPGETLFPLHGLEYPRNNDDTPILEYDSGKLFLQSALRVNPSFVVTDDDLPPIAEICHTVRGMPLALELAAGWMHMLSPAEIRDEIQHNLDILEGTGPSKSIRAIFDSSWQKLDLSEREILVQLAVFKGGFTRQPAQVVAQAGLRILNILLSKGLISRGDNGRYELHELLEKYLLEKGREYPELIDKAQEAHCQYFASCLAENEADILSGNQASVLADFENIYQVWYYAIETDNPLAIHKMREAFWALFDAQSWYQEGAAAFNLAVNMLETHYDDRMMRINYGRCLALYGYFLGQTGNVKAGYKTTKQGIEILQECQAKEEHILSVGLLADLATSDKQLHEAKDLIEANLQFLDQSTITRMGSVLLRYAQLLEYLGQGTQAQDALNRAQHHELQQDRAKGKANVNLQQGGLDRRQGKHEQARHRLLKSLEEYRTLGYQQGIAWALNGLGRNAIEMETLAEGRAYYLDALQIAHNLKILPIVLDTLVGLAEVSFLQSEFVLSATLLYFVMSQSLNVETRQHADKIWDQLAENLSENDLTHAELSGQGADLVDIIALLVDN